MNGFSAYSKPLEESTEFTPMSKRERHQYRLLSQPREAERLVHQLPLLSTAEEVVTDLATIQNKQVFKYGAIWI